MKKSLLAAFAVSLAANAALLFVMVKPSATTANNVTSKKSPTMGPGQSEPAKAQLTEEQMRGLALTADILATTDLTTQVSRLRAAGFPADIIRGIITAQVARDFGARRKAAVARLEVMPFWKLSQDTFPPDRKAGSEVNNLLREQNRLIKKLLGPDAQPDDEWSQLLRERRFGYLPAEKVDRMQEILADYAEMRTQATQEARGFYLPEDQAKMALIEKEQRADLANLFTPEELENYDLHTSNLSNQLRFQLAAFNPTEEEFREIYKIYAAAGINRKGAMTINGSGATSVDPVTAQIQTILTPERAAEYAQTTDPSYQQANQLVTRLDLPASLVPQIVATQKDIQQRVNAIMQDRTLTAENRKTQIGALMQEAQTTLTASLGESGFTAYRNYGGWWLNNLSQLSGLQFKSNSTATK